MYGTAEAVPLRWRGWQTGSGGRRGGCRGLERDLFVAHKAVDRGEADHDGAGKIARHGFAMGHAFQQSLQGAHTMGLEAGQQLMKLRGVITGKYVPY